MHIFQDTVYSIEHVAKITGIAVQELNKLNDQPEYQSADGRWHIEKIDSLSGMLIVTNRFRQMAVAVESRAYAIERALKSPIAPPLTDRQRADAQAQLEVLQEQIKDLYAKATR